MQPPQHFSKTLWLAFCSSFFILASLLLPTEFGYHPLGFIKVSLQFRPDSSFFIFPPVLKSRKNITGQSVTMWEAGVHNSMLFACAFTCSLVCFWELCGAAWPRRPFMLRKCVNEDGSTLLPFTHALTHFLAKESHCTRSGCDGHLWGALPSRLPFIPFCLSLCVSFFSLPLSLSVGRNIA